MEITKENTTIGFIGIGVMGKSMAGHLLKAGYQVVIFNRTKGKAEELIKLGAQWQDTIAGLAVRSNIIITMVGYPKDVEEIYFGSEGIIKHAKSGTCLVDMTTSSPMLAQKIYFEAKEKGLCALDAPVSGGDIGAQDAKLSIMVGGDEKVFKALVPIFKLIGKNIVWQGESGAGQHTKMCNQIAIAGNMIGVSEAMAYAKHSGLNPDKVLQSIESGAAGSWSLTNLAPRMLASDFEPGFYVKHFIKDMTIALDSAKDMGLDTPGLKLAKLMYDQLAERGEENSGTQSIYKLYCE